MYAIVRTGGKQYQVEEGSVIVVDKVHGEPGDEIALKEVLLLNKDGETQVGKPFVHGVKVTAKILQQFKDEKIDGFTYKPKKNIARRYGHRQLMTELSVENIELEK